MQIILVGMNHKTASVGIRERLAFNMHSSTDAMQKLKAAYPDCEFVLLSTCNRVECYAAVMASTGPSPKELTQFLAGLKNADYEHIHPCFYTKVNDDAVRHLLTVGSGLDSMVIGENQIIAQTKESYKLACEIGSSGKILHHLFHVAFHTTKEIISTTSISSRRVSVAGVAVDLAKRLFATIPSARIVVAGAGQMGELIVDRFRHNQCNNIAVVNRDYHRGCQVAQKHHAEYKPWETLEEEIAGADIVIGAAAAHDGYLFDSSQLEKIISRRQNRHLLIIDITVPRSFDPAIGKINGIHLYSIDDLGQSAQDNIKLRESDLEAAIEIICNHTAEFMDWFKARDIGPLIGKIKHTFERVRDTELKKLFTGPLQDAAWKEQMELSTGNIVNKLLYRVVKTIDAIAKERSISEAERFAQGIVEYAETMLGDETFQEKAVS